MNIGDDEYVGQTEIMITSINKIVELGKLIEKSRTFNSTNMNATSSRCHFYIDFKMYKRHGDKFRMNIFKFVDLAGSERVGKTGSTPGRICES